MSQLSRRSFLKLASGLVVAAVAAPAYIAADRLDFGVPKAIATAPTLREIRESVMRLWGDGIHDDTAALQALIDAGGFVQLPPGRFRTTGPLVLGGDRQWGGVSGSGHGATKIVFEGDSAFRLTPDAQNWRIDNFWLEHGDPTRTAKIMINLPPDWRERTDCGPMPELR